MTEPEPSATASVALVQRAQAGDQEALNLLFARYYNRVRKIVRLRMGRLRNRMESADIVQKTFIAAVGNFDRFELRDESSLINWLAKIAERQIKGEIKRAEALKRGGLDQEKALHGIRTATSEGTLTLDPVADVELPLDAVDKDEQREILEECIGELKYEWREVIILRNYTRASWKTVAEEMGSPSVDASRMLYARALVELSEMVRRRLKQ